MLGFRNACFKILKSGNHCQKQNPPSLKELCFMFIIDFCHTNPTEFMSLKWGREYINYLGIQRGLRCYDCIKFDYLKIDNEDFVDWPLYWDLDIIDDLPIPLFLKSQVKIYRIFCRKLIQRIDFYRQFFDLLNEKMVPGEISKGLCSAILFITQKKFLNNPFDISLFELADPGWGGIGLRTDIPRGGHGQPVTLYHLSYLNKRTFMFQTFLQISLQDIEIDCEMGLDPRTDVLFKEVVQFGGQFIQKFNSVELDFSDISAGYEHDTYQNLDDNILNKLKLFCKGDKILFYKLSFFLRVRNTTATTFDLNNINFNIFLSKESI